MRMLVQPTDSSRVSGATQSRTPQVDAGERVAMGVVPQSVTGDLVHLGPRLRCPRCRANIQALGCTFCGFRMRVKNGIVHALPPETL
jgi:hypothetical protein